MHYDGSGNNLDAALNGPKVRDALLRKATIGARFWTAKSIVDTGFNSRSVKTIVGEDGGRAKAVIYAFGYYARFREHGTRFNAPERVLHRSVDAMKNG